MKKVVQKTKPKAKNEVPEIRVGDLVAWRAKMGQFNPTTGLVGLVVNIELHTPIPYHVYWFSLKNVVRTAARRVELLTAKG